MQPAATAVFQVQMLRARIKALEEAGDALKKLVPKDAAKARNAVTVWNLTKQGGKRADKK